MNAVERLWAAAAARDWAGVRAQLAPGLHVEQPVEDRVLRGPDVYVEQLVQRLDGDALAVVLQVVAEGKQVACEVDVRRHPPRRVAMFATLVDGRVHRAVELWVALPEPR